MRPLASLTVALRALEMALSFDAGDSEHRRSRQAFANDDQTRVVGDDC